MKCIYYAASKPREIMLARALADGMRVHGDELEIRQKGEYGEDCDGNDRRYPGPTSDTDLAVVFGVKSAQCFHDHRALDIPVLYIDKGYSRQTSGIHTVYSRMCINASSPVSYMMATDRAPDRLERLGLKLQKYRGPTDHGHIMYAGSSQKYHEFHHLGDGYVIASKAISRISKMSGGRQMVYRPKPRDRSAKPVQGAAFSTGSQSITDALRGCHLLVTHGASACFDAIVQGVPTAVLGEGVARPVSCAIDIPEQIARPAFPSDRDRLRWLSALAYVQWTVPEIQSGEAWGVLRAEVDRQKQAAARKAAKAAAAADAAVPASNQGESQ